MPPAPSLPPTPTLPAGPVVLRPWEPADVAVVLVAARDPHIPWITTVPTGGGETAAREWIARQHRRVVDGEGHSFAIADASTGEAQGQIGLFSVRTGPGAGRIGYWVGGPHRRRGILTHALPALVEWGLAERGLARLDLHVEPWNAGSWRAAERAGFACEGLARHLESVGDERRDMLVYARTHLTGDDPALESARLLAAHARHLGRADVLRRALAEAEHDAAGGGHRR